MTPLPSVHWILQTSDNMLHCLRCGASTILVLSSTVDELVSWINQFERAHQTCGQVIVISDN